MGHSLIRRLRECALVELSDMSTVADRGLFSVTGLCRHSLSGVVLFSLHWKSLVLGKAE